MPQVKDLIAKYHSSLGKIYSKSEIDHIIRVLFADYSNLFATDLATKKETQLSKSEISKHQVALKKLKQGMPLQYVSGYAYFFGLKFLVNKNVLIPRPETEELVEWIIEHFKNYQLSTVNYQLLDIGTGSGCIAIALKKYLPQIKVTAIDKSKRALTVAQQNAISNHTDIHFIQTDINSQLSILNSQFFDLIVSNPPYIPLSEKSSLHKSVIKFEPHSALFVKSSDPLLFYQKIVEFSKSHLKPGGYLFFEVHQNNAKSVVKLIKEHGFSEVELKKDLSGNDRMVKAIKVIPDNQSLNP